MGHTILEMKGIDDSWRQVLHCGLDVQLKTETADPPYTPLILYSLIGVP